MFRNRRNSLLCLSLLFYSLFLTAKSQLQGGGLQPHKESLVAHLNLGGDLYREIVEQDFALLLSLHIDVKTL